MNPGSSQPTRHKPTWYILGAGAIGSLWACYWRKAGFPVVIITRNDEPRTELTLIVNEQPATFDVQSLSIRQLASSSIRLQHLLISTKAQHTLAAVSAIQSHIDEKATVLLLQNGMAGTRLPQLLPTQRLISAITNDGAYRTATDTVVYAGRGETFVGCDEPLLDLLPSSELNIHRCDDIAQRQWRKLAINCAINGLTAIYRCRNGELLNNPQALQEIEAICAEVIAVGEVLQLNAPGENQQTLITAVHHTLNTTANNYSSMYQDIDRGQSTEIDYLNGYICELAEQHGIDCPANAAVLNQIRQ